MSEASKALADKLEKVSGFGLTGWVRQYLTLSDRQLIIAALRSQPGTLAREALDREEAVLIAEYHSGRLNGNLVIKAAFERLRALTPSHDATRAQTIEDCARIVHDYLVKRGVPETAADLISHIRDLK
jgi:hypothetical protein